MKNKIFSIAVILTILSVPLMACAVYYVDDGTDNDNPNVDKFVPTSGVKIKESGLARMMENATRDAMDSSKGNKKSSVQKKTQQTKQENSNSYQRSYKWF